MDVEDGIAAIREHPILGGGVGARITSGRLLMYGSPEESLIVHQALIHTWAKFGLLGLTVFCTTLGFTVFAGSRALKRGYASRGTGAKGVLLVAALAFVLADFVWQMFTPPFYQNFQRTFLASLAVTAVLYYSQRPSVPAAVHVRRGSDGGGKV
jgi:O-antigen ligase